MTIKEEEELLNSSKTLAELEEIGADRVQELFRKNTKIDIITVGKDEDDVFGVAIDYEDYTMSLEWDTLAKDGYSVRAILQLYKRSHTNLENMCSGY